MDIDSNEPNTNKISNKIYFLTFYLLIALVVSSYLGLTQITKISGKLHDVVENDLVLLNIIKPK